MYSPPSGYDNVWNDVYIFILPYIVPNWGLRQNRPPSRTKTVQPFRICDGTHKSGITSNISWSATVSRYLLTHGTVVPFSPIYIVISINNAAWRFILQPHLIQINSSQFAINQPWRCLCFGFSQMTLMLPFLLMILHFSQIGFTDDLTFMVLPPFTNVTPKIRCKWT